MLDGWKSMSEKDKITSTFRLIAALFGLMFVILIALFIISNGGKV